MQNQISPKLQMTNVTLEEFVFGQHLQARKFANKCKEDPRSC